ncbi:hypothetical protein [Sorangium sp. So ce128]|uniref:hypothetical protein n=1 Tax=Sorangium sp. So ce128 TaxID=3133281 RepID=UPI003F5F5F62
MSASIPAASAVRRSGAAATAEPSSARRRRRAQPEAPRRASGLPELAARAVREGCVGETLAAVQASEQRSRATDAAVRSALATIAEDEAWHAELAWRFVAWALQTGGEPVRRAVSEAFEAALASPPPAATAPDAEADALAAHGRPDGAALATSHRRAVAEVIAPAMRALLGAWS